MRIVIAPDKFKGALAAADAAEAIARSVLAVHPDAQIVRCPMADGGEGTVPALIAATGGRLVRELVTGPLPHMQVDAEFGITGDGQTAVIEMAAASGLALVPDHLRNPYNTTTYGTGQLMRLAADMGARRIILGIGGSATVDGGIGALQALGATFVLDGDGSHGQPLVGHHLSQIVEVKRPADWKLPEILIACDVENPLCGPEGAAAVFGPQKGATPEQVKELDLWLGKLATTMHAQSLAAAKGSGAAGGLGFGLGAMIPNVRMAGGFSLVAEACDFEGKLRGADLCITAEGRFDQSSLKGKTAVGVARTCERLNVPCLILAGSVDPDAERQVKAATASIVNGPMSLEDAMKQTSRLLETATRRMVRAMT